MSTNYGGYTGKVLHIDLSTREFSEYPWTDQDRELYLGGKIMAAKILYDNLTTKIDPFSAANLLVITTGPLTGSGAPSSSRFNISTLSPLTGFIASSNCGGSFGLFLKKAGYDALILAGKAPEPVWIEIHNETVAFHTAGGLWGKTTGETQKLLGAGIGKIVIGPAGENLVRYASIASGERMAGRAGVGAVMGSKHLKAVVVSGDNTVRTADRTSMKKVYQSWLKQLREHPLTGKLLPKLGTAGLLIPMNAHKILATRNYQYGQYKDFELISGETLAAKHLVKNRGCQTCPIQCGRVVRVEGQEVKGPELETLGLLGSNLENNDLELIFRWNLLLDELGMDTISTGSTIAFAMELQEKGLWSNGLQFGQTANLENVFADIAYRRGIGDLLAEGTKRLAERFGGQAFAIQSKGLELAAYEPRGAVGLGLGYATANRGGCHLNAGYLVILEGLGLNMDPHTPKAKAALTITFQNIMEAVSAGGSCVFTLFAMIPSGLVSQPNRYLTRLVGRALKHSGGMVHLINKLSAKFLAINLPLLPQSSAIRSVTGLSMNFGKFRDIGERGFTLERMFNLRMGLTANDDSLPERLTVELQDLRDQRTRVPLDKMKKEYYRKRGWDAEGRPRAKTLRRLGLLERV